MTGTQPPSPCWFDWSAGEDPIALEWPLGLSIVEDALLEAFPSIGVPLSKEQAITNNFDWFLQTAVRRAAIRLGSVGSGSRVVPDRAPLDELLRQHLHEGEFPGEPRPVDVATMTPLAEEDFVCVARWGSWKDERIHREANARFGVGNWRMGYSWGDWTLDVRSGIQIYEDGYYHVLRNDPELLQWTLSYCDVFDTNPSNVASYCDYSVQEVENAGQHWQDVAIRRVLRRLGLWFGGEELLEIRGHESEGYRLNPGQLPFHRPDLLVSPRQWGWWRPDSIEDFSISNFAIQVPLPIVRDYLRSRDPDQESGEVILMAQHPELLPEMARFAATGGLRAQLFVFRALQLMRERTGADLFGDVTLPLGVRELWELFQSGKQEHGEVIDRLLSAEPEVRREGLAQISLLESKLRIPVLKAASEDPARKLRNQAQRLLVEPES